jgi:hypothetical protein
MDHLESAQSAMTNGDIDEAETRCAAAIKIIHRCREADVLLREPLQVYMDIYKKRTQNTPNIENIIKGIALGNSLVNRLPTDESKACARATIDELESYAIQHLGGKKLHMEAFHAFDRTNLEHISSIRKHCENHLKQIKEQIHNLEENGEDEFIQKVKSLYSWISGEWGVSLRPCTIKQ